MVRQIFILLLFVKLAFAFSIEKLSIYTENYPPYNMKRQGELTGISVELLQHILKELNLDKKIKIKLLPWATAYKIVTKKSNTMLFSTTRTKPREKLFKWVGPIIPTKIGIIAPKHSHIVINNIKDLNNYKIGAVINDIGEQILIEKGIDKKNIKSISGKNPVLINFRKMAKGRIDLVVYEINVMMYGAKLAHLEPDHFEVVKILKEGELYYAFNKDTDDAIINKFQSALDKLKQNGIYDQIIRKYK